MGFSERIYQGRAVNAAFDAYAAGNQSALIVLPTGTGKTRVAAMLASRMLEERGRRTLFLAHRDALVNQAYEAFLKSGMDAAVEMGGQNAQDHAALFGASSVVVGSVPTMQRARLAGWDRDHFGLVIVDECHHSLAQSYLNIFNHFNDRYVAGLTATPDRGDKRSLGSIFQVKAFDYPLATALKGNDGDDPGGWLVKPVHLKCAVSVDLRGIRCSKGAAGDFNTGDLEERIGPSIERLARAIRREIGDRQAVVFMPDCGSSQAMEDVLNKLEQEEPIGVNAAYVAGSGGKFGMPKPERNARLADFAAKRYRVLVNCDLCFEGWDCVAVAAVVVCRPTRLRYRYAQMVGRGLRPDPDNPSKRDCLVIDFDWQTDADARDLAMTVDLFDDGELNEDVIRIAREIERSKPAGAIDDPDEIVEEAKEIFRVRSRLDIKLTGASEQYRKLTIDPLCVGDLLDWKFNKKHNMDTKGDNPASAGQIAYLKSLGIDRPDGISKWGATKLIDKLAKRKAEGLASLGQVKALLGAGVNPEIARSLSHDSALKAITEIDRANRILPTTQKELF